MIFCLDILHHILAQKNKIKNGGHRIRLSAICSQSNASREEKTRAASETKRKLNAFRKWRKLSKLNKNRIKTRIVLSVTFLAKTNE